MDTELIPGVDAFDRLAAEWDRLAEQGMTNTPFQSLAYQRAWWRHLQPAGASLWTLAVRDNGGGLAALACFYLLDGVLHFNGCVEETDYLDLLAAPADALAGWTAIFDCLTSPGFPDWREMELCNIPAISGSRSILLQLARRHDLAGRENIDEVCPVISLPGTYDAYLQMLPSKQRREIQRKLRRAEAAGVQLERIKQDDDLTSAVDDFLQLLQKSTFEKRDWLNEGRRAVYHETARALQAAGRLQLLFLTLDGARVAGLFNFDYDNRIWVYNSGLDPTQYARLSLGVVLTARAIELSIEEGRATFDFLRGSESYKYRFGAEDTPVYRFHASREVVS